MIRLQFCDKPEAEREKIVNEYYNCNIRNRAKRKIAKLEEWCEKYLQNVKQSDGSLPKSYNFRGVVEALPKELMSMKEHIDNHPNSAHMMKELKGQGAKARCYISDTLYGDRRREARKMIIESLSVTVCPYCNRNYVFSKENVDTCELDHYIPKGKYPIFAISFYNLIPCCPICNRKKGEEQFDFYPHDKDSRDNEIRFTYHLKGVDYSEDASLVVVKIQSSEKLKNQIEVLKLDKIYKHHNDIVFEIIKKYHVFNKAYCNSLYHEFSDLFASEEEVTQMIFGTQEKKKYGLRPLSKMITEILKEIENM